MLSVLCLRTQRRETYADLFFGHGDCGAAFRRHLMLSYNLLQMDIHVPRTHVPQAEAVAN